MGFTYSDGSSLINTEQKVRISLSETAMLTIKEDMLIFSVDKLSTFINTVFENYRDEAYASISVYAEQRRMDLNEHLASVKLDEPTLKSIIDPLIQAEIDNIQDTVKQYTASKSSSNLYRINNNNVDYLTYDCKENLFYKSPGQYIRSVIEEYCSLSFIDREAIYKKPIYDKIKQACKEQLTLRIIANYYGKDQNFIVYPYKIVHDAFHTQSYLVCYSYKAEESPKNKRIASFSMARITMPRIISKSSHLSKEQKEEIDKQLAKASPAYLVGDQDTITVRLTEKGKKSYQSRIYSRPEIIKQGSTPDEYVFDCTAQQAFNYFFPFGAEAEIISPSYLRERFIRTHKNALAQYKH